MRSRVVEAHYPTIDEPATPEYVLAVIQDMHRQQCQYDPEADPDAVLAPETAVAEWRSACDLVGWRDLGRAHNLIWDIDCSEAEWYEALEPAGDKSLSDVCRLIAGHARRPRVRPACLLGRACLPAGAFLTVRSLLHQAGASAEEIAPSTPLGPYTRRNADVFLGPISRLAPGSLPPVRIRIPLYDAAISGMLAGLLCLLFGACSGWYPLAIAGGALLATCRGLTGRRLLPASVEFGELQTFRDLADAIARGDRI